MPTAKQMAWIKAVAFIAALIPLGRLVMLGLQGDLGANPVEFVTHFTGIWALVMLMITLSMTPIRLLTGMTWQIRLRRMTGLFMFFYACLHFLTYVWLDHWFAWSEIGKDIVKHPYVLVGFSALLLTVPLAITSNRAMIMKLGERWKQLHRLVYLIAVLGVLHFWWLVKKDIREPLIYALILALLFGIRLYYRRPATKPRERTKSSAARKLETNRM